MTTVDLALSKLFEPVSAISGMVSADLLVFFVAGGSTSITLGASSDLGNGTSDPVSAAGGAEIPSSALLALSDVVFGSEIAALVFFGRRRCLGFSVIAASSTSSMSAALLRRRRGLGASAAASVSTGS